MKTLVLVFEFKPAHGLAVRHMDMIQDAEVNSDTVARVRRFNIGFSDRSASLVSIPKEMNYMLVVLFFIVTSFISVSSVISRRWRILISPIVESQSVVCRSLMFVSSKPSSEIADF